MWEYEKASDEELAAASAKCIINYLNTTPEKESTNFFHLQEVADAFCALSPRIKFYDFNDYKKLENYVFEYVLEPKKNEEMRKFMKDLLQEQSGDAGLSEEDFLRTALKNSPEYLLTLRRAQELVSRSTYLFNNDYCYHTDLEKERWLDNGSEICGHIFDNDKICEKLAKACASLPDNSEAKKLISEENYPDAFDVLLSENYEVAKDFIEDCDHSNLLYEYYDWDSFIEDCLESLTTDFDYFKVPTDGGFIEFADNIGWRSESGAKVFELSSGSKNMASEFLDLSKALDDGNRTTIVKYRVGEPFLHITEYSHDAPTGTPMTVVPEAWLKDALKFKDIRETFEKNPLLRDIILVDELKSNLEKVSHQDPVAAMYRVAMEDYLDSLSFADFYDHHGVSDLVYNVAMDMARSDMSAKKPKDIFNAIVKLSPKEAFDEEWMTKDKLQRDFDDTVANYKKYHMASAR